RIAPAANSFFLCGVLQSGPYALGLGQRHAAGSGSPAVRRHCRHPNLVRLAPPLRPDMIFGKDRSRTWGKQGVIAMARLVDTRDVFKQAVHCFRCDEASYFTLRAWFAVPRPSIVKAMTTTVLPPIVSLTGLRLRTPRRCS